jgi:hypothetical protein
MLAEELVILDGGAPLWNAARPLLDVALRLEQCEESYTWHGWNKQQISSFLKSLPPKCSLVVGVWETALAGDDEDKQNEQNEQNEQNGQEEQESLVLGVICEVVDGEVCSIRSFEALAEDGLKAVEDLEPGVDDALEIMRVVKTQVAPVAWALFTDKAAWNEWLFADDDEGRVVNKGDILASFARQGRCVIMGSETAHHHLS